MSVRTSARFQQLVEAVGRELDVATGIAWQPYDEAQIDPIELEQFVRTLLVEWAGNHHAVYRGIMGNLVAALVSLCVASGVSVEIGDDELATLLPRYRRHMSEDS